MEFVICQLVHLYPSYVWNILPKKNPFKCAAFCFNFLLIKYFMPGYMLINCFHQHSFYNFHCFIVSTWISINISAIQLLFNSFSQLFFHYYWLRISPLRILLTKNLNFSVIYRCFCVLAITRRWIFIFPDTNFKQWLHEYWIISICTNVENICFPLLRRLML